MKVEALPGTIDQAAMASIIRKVGAVNCWNELRFWDICYAIFDMTFS